MLSWWVKEVTWNNPLVAFATTPQEDSNNDDAQSDQCGTDFDTGLSTRS
jgi:beta-lactamase class D